MSIPVKRLVPTSNRPMLDHATINIVEDGIYKVLVGQRQIGTLFKLPMMKKYRFCNDLMFSSELKAKPQSSLKQLQDNAYEAWLNGAPVSVD